MAKVLVSIDDDLLRSVDRAARREGVSRSAYLARLARSDLARSSGPGTLPSAQRALARLDALFAQSRAGDSTREIRRERDSR